tara:strand:+ start:242 stop:382 length:141 start_codon:yes stop_codon:yes gene_type:complete
MIDWYQEKMAMFYKAWEIDVDEGREESAKINMSHYLNYVELEKIFT